MEKDFIKWHHLKEKLQRRAGGLVFNEGDVWLCALGLNLGHEEDGKGDVFLRPIFIMKKINRDTFWAIPITSREKIGSHHYSFDFGGRQMIAMLTQIRLLDRKRLWRKKGTITPSQFFAIVKKFKLLLP